MAPHHLGGNNEQNYCVQLSSIKQRMYNLCTVITLKIWGAWARFGGACAPWPQHRTATGHAACTGAGRRFVFTRQAAALFRVKWRHGRHL